MKRKRASLPATRRAQPRDAAKPDFTDRLLDPSARPAKSGKPKSGRPKPGSQGSEVVPSPAPSAGRSGSSGSPAAEPGVPEAAAEATLEHALEASRQAVAALSAAARSTPARYHVAVRYRLDALAHHLEQVAQFLAAFQSR